ncbi:MAG: ABC transporter ATP-binding protein [Clostridia bacterium]|nr:ABC transporter ATP-binding protein [Clostridia bacterium]
MIEIKNFSKSYGKTNVYENFNLTLEENRVTCILGESGSGKTTLLNAVANLPDYEGTITKKTCSYIFQSPCLVPNLTVFKNLKLVCRDEEKISAMLEAVKLSDKSNKYPVNLSGGEAQRVSIARAYLVDGDVILMDEPFSSLDLKLKFEMSELFFDLWQKDKRCALFVTHDIDEAVRIAHRIIVLDKGKIVYDVKADVEPPRSEISALREKIVSVMLSDKL